MPASVMTRVLAVGSRVPAGAALLQPDDDPALAGPAIGAAGWLVTDTADLATQHCVLVP